MKKMKRDKKIILILSIILAVLILGNLFVYLFLIKPSMNGLVILGRSQGWNQGYGFAVASLMQEALSCEPVPVTLGNQAINVIALECLE